MKTVRTAASKMGTASSRVSFNPQKNNYQLFLEKKNEYGEWVLRIKDGKYQDYFFDTNRLPLGGNSIYQEIMESGSNSIRSVVESVTYGIYPSNLFQLLYILEHVEKFDPSRFIVEYTLKVPLIGALVQGMVAAIQFLFNDGGILKLAKLSEIEKASYFKSSSRCTTAILMFDFLNGQGPHVRFFDESHAIVKDLKWGTLSDLAFEKWLKLDKTGSVVEGVPFKISVKTSFDNSDFDTGFEVIKKGALSGEASFWRGSANYTFTKIGDELLVEVSDSYSISSGVSRNPNDNLERVRNFVCPMSNTYLRMNFKYKLLDEKRVDS